jgi:four helix bundle protein
VTGGFFRLEVYARRARLADEIRASVQFWPAIDRWSSGIQVIRAADSVGANIAEAFGRRSRPDKVRFLIVARGSLNELQHWLARASERRLPVPAGAIGRADQVGRMLNGLLRFYQQPATCN